jgi:hypothetical protein
MKNLDQELKAHLRELESFYYPPPGVVRPGICKRESRSLQACFKRAASRRAPRGRPAAWHSRNERTFQSFEVFVVAAGEMRTFKMRQGIERVPVKVRDAFIEFARRECPLARKETILEHLRKDQALLPRYSEPTCFLLMRVECEDGNPAGVIIAGPSDLRLAENAAKHIATIKAR